MATVSEGGKPVITPCKRSAARGRDEARYISSNSEGVQ